MLALLHIENIAVIEEADITFDRGFNALTGETGAGKSIVIDALSAVLGHRTSRDIIRTGAAKAFVSAVFTETEDLEVLSEYGLAPEEGELLLQREISAEGRNVCRVGGRPVTVAQLRRIGASLLDIHGQQDGQQLLDEERHGAYLDSFGGVEAEHAAYAECWKAMEETRRKLRSLQMDESEKARRMDSLTFQISELERAELIPGEDEELQQKRTVSMPVLSGSFSAKRMEKRTLGMSSARSSSWMRSSRVLAAALRASERVRAAFMALSSSLARSFSRRAERSAAKVIWSSSSRHLSRYASMSSTVGPYFFFRR